MNAKTIFAVMLTFAALPAAHADEYFGRGSQSSPIASKVVTAPATVDRLGRSSSHSTVATAPKSEVKAKLATVSEVAGRA
ncbi:MAG TPA: hypothetical protein VFV71_04635 [Burkholderiales bacterium]|nr:hypothetical protein [Burkholderiales bacterium]